MPDQRDAAPRRQRAKTTTSAPAHPRPGATWQPRRADLVVAGAPAACWVLGSDGAQRRMVALHGLRGTHHGLLPSMTGLRAVADGALQVLIPDLPGFGQSPPLARGAHDVDGYAAWARALLAQVGAPALLAGHSFGSVVAAAVAASSAPAPALAGLVLLNPIAAPPLSGRRRLAAGATSTYHHLAGVLPESAGTALLRWPLATWAASALMLTTHDRALRAWVHAEHHRHFTAFADRRVLLQCYRAATGHDVSEHAGGVRAPTLVIAGALDEIAPIASQRALVSLLHQATLVQLPATGHLAHYEAPSAVAAAIDAFLAGLPG